MKAVIGRSAKLQISQWYPADVLRIMSSTYDFPYQTKSSPNRVASGFSSSKSEISSANRSDGAPSQPIGVVSSSAPNILQKSNSLCHSSAKKAFFGSRTVTPQKHVVETDSITRKNYISYCTVDILRFFSGLESDPMTIQLKLPDGSGILSLVASLCLLFAAGHYVHGKTYLQILSSIFRSRSILGFFCGILNRTLLVALSDKDRKSGTAYSTVLKQSAMGAILVACITGEMISIAFFFLLGKLVLIKQYNPATGSAICVSTTTVESTEVQEKGNGLLYNSGIGNLALKRRFA